MRTVKIQSVKKVLLLAFFSVMVLCCSAQLPLNHKRPSDDSKKSKRKSNPKPKPTVPMLFVKVMGNHNFYLLVDEEEYGKTAKEKPRTIKMGPGVHRLVFEEADSTGEKIEHYFRVTKEMIKQRDTLYTVNFKKDYLEIIQPNQTNSPAKQGGGDNH